MVAEEKANRMVEIRRVNERDVIGFFLNIGSIKEGTKRDLQPTDFIYKDTREAFNDMSQGYFYEKDKMSNNFQNMIICRGADSNVFKKINYLIGMA